MLHHILIPDLLLKPPIITVCAPTIAEALQNGPTRHTIPLMPVPVAEGLERLAIPAPAVKEVAYRILVAPG